MYIHNIDPILLNLGIIEIRWYSLAYIIGILIGWYLAKKYFASKIIRDRFDDYVTYVIVGLILGGRLGYVFFYNFGYYFNNFFEIFKVWQGGMSFHGGVIGIVIASIIFSKKNSEDTFKYLDIIALVSPIGIFFGRIANFINSELYGIETSMPWGVKFIQIDNLNRHPTQIYEAILEGLILFLILLFFWNRMKDKKPGKISSLFLIFYSIFRFLIEYLREPDHHLGLIFNYFSMGQLLCIPLFVAGLAIFFRKRQ